MTHIQTHLSKDFLRREGETMPEAIASLKQSVEKFATAMQAVQEENWFVPTAPNKWSAAQISDHVAKLNAVFARVIAMAGQNPELLATQYGQISEAGKPIAPKSLEPKDNQTCEEILLKLQQSLEKLIAAAENETDLHAPRMMHPFLGVVSTLEMVQNAAWHARHHAKQLQSG